MSIYVYINSSADSLYFPQNEPYRFKCKLNKTLYLDGKWDVCITEILFTGDIKSNYDSLFNVYCDVCAESFINEEYEPLLRRVFLEKSGYIVFTPLYYLPVIKSEISEIELFIKNNERNYAHTLKYPTEVVLHFKSRNS